MILHTLIAVLLGTQAPSPTARSLVDRYVRALGGEAALRAVRTRVSEGRFDNGRGLKTRFRVFEEAPNKRATVIGTDPIEADTGSGRAYDGAVAWDKNFVGTGLRRIAGRELAGVAREADMLRPLHLLNECPSTSVEASTDDDVAVCEMQDGSRIRLRFARRTGLLTSQETIGADGQLAITVSFEDYRLVDDVRVPFTTRVLLPRATITYTAEIVRQNQPIDHRVFERPRG